MRCNKRGWSLGQWLGKALGLLGETIAVRPVETLVLSVLFACVCASGIFWIKRELDPIRLWVPEGSRFSTDTQWMKKKFGVAVRSQYLIATAPNVLQPEILSRLAVINKAVSDIRAPLENSTVSYEDVCFKIPSVPSRKKRSVFDDDFDENFFSDNSTNVDINLDESLDPGFYCSILEGFPLACYQQSILELWDFNAITIGKFTYEEIIEKINKKTTASIIGQHIDYEQILGGIKRDASDRIISAESILFVWYLYVNITDMDTSHHGNDASTELWASETALAWEQGFVDVMVNASQNISDFKLFYSAERTFGDLSSDSMFRDMGKLSIGIVLMFIYIQIILSKFNWVEIKLILGNVGMSCVGLALIVSYGVCGFIGIPFGPVHSSLPFLLLGLGIDDMFIMKSCWEQMTDDERNLPFPKQIGLMLEHAGTSIIVTSFTDIIAFLIGSITILPSLQSFCIYAAVGVFFIFVFVITFYVAVFVLDVKRVNAKRNGVVPCIKHPDFVPSNYKDIPISQYILDKLYSNFILTLPVKIFIILLTIVITCFSIEGLLKLEQKFDSSWFIPENSYHHKFLSTRNQFYPEMGTEASVFLGALNYSHELPNIYNMIEKLENETDKIYNLLTWTKPFRSFVSSNLKKDIKVVKLSDSEWNLYLSTFLHTMEGYKYLSKFRFDGELKCGHPAPPVIVSSISFNFKLFNSSKIYIPIMHHLQDIVQNTNITTGDKFFTLWARAFSFWTTDEVIYTEMQRNVGLALACVMICTLIIVGNFQMCFWIFVCVFLTLVNTCGWMQKLGLTIDIVTSIALELGIGFCVDYAAHIGHKFLTVYGTRHDRSLKTVTSIGAAVMYGGGSTLLSLCVLSLSEAYVFKAFFKIFSLVIIFGLFNGLLFLPIVLSFIGPSPYKLMVDKEPEVLKTDEKIDKLDQNEMVTLNKEE